MALPPRLLLVLALACAVTVAGCASSPSGTRSATTAQDLTGQGSPSVTHAPATSATTHNGPACLPRAFDPTETATRTLTFRVVEPTPGNPCFGFAGPTRAAAGWVTMTLENDGQAPHVMVLNRLDAGRTFEDVLAALADPHGDKPDWVHEAGGVGFLSPGRSATVVQHLEPGTYLMFCWVDGHVMQGMAQELRVEESNDEGEAPEADVELTLSDFNFTFSHPIAAGRHVIAVRNAGPQFHEAPILLLHGNATPMEFADAVQSGQGPPPGDGVGGVNPFPPGETVYVILEFQAGRYGLLCFVADEADADGAPHVAKGMVAEFTVAAS